MVRTVMYMLRAMRSELKPHLSRQLYFKFMQPVRREVYRCLADAYELKLPMNLSESLESDHITKHRSEPRRELAV